MTILEHDDTILIRLVREKGRVRVEDAKENMRPTGDRWIRHGLAEYVGPRTNPEPRHTVSDHPEFLARLKGHLEPQFPDFEYILE